MNATEQAPNILEVLDGIAFPATTIELVSYAEDQDASEEVLDLIKAMPDRDYHSIADINRSLGRIEELPGSENLWSSASLEDEGTNSETSLALDERFGTTQ